MYLNISLNVSFCQHLDLYLHILWTTNKSIYVGLDFLCVPIRCASIALVLMIHTSLNLYSHFGFMLWSCDFISCICLFCQTLRYTWIPLESFAFHANLYIYGLNCVLGICMYTYCVDNSYIYLEMKLVLVKI